MELKQAASEYLELRQKIRSSGMPPHPDYWSRTIEEAESNLKAAISAAAPQVVADERAAFKAWFMRDRGMRVAPSMAENWPDPDRTYEGDAVECCWQGWQARVALAAAPVPSNSPELHGIAAAPVQAQEPAGYINPAFLAERRSEFEKNGTVMFAWQCGECTSPIYRAPVQPLAVPDGWKLMPIEATRTMIDAASAVEEDGYDAMHKAMIAAAPAAPAAQGDAKDAARLDFVLKEGAFLTWKNRDGSILQCQLMNQDEDEDFHTLSGPDDRYFNTPRQAIDAAIAAKAAS